ncbi:MAG: 1,4-beta-xylanase [Lachnospiraceae bacterium]|nr:1,4-beta-xylanase [Lachnospiraceae bacterium]
MNLTTERFPFPYPIHAVTFAPFVRKGVIFSEEAKESLLALRERTGANSVIIVPAGLQDTAQSETIQFAEGELMGDEELISMIDFAHEKGLAVFLKPTVNCKNGTWRAHINFFDEDVPCEPKWGNWFKSYSAFQCHYARIAEKNGCEMFIAGCEMVMSERREKEWRATISDIREHYTGPVSYNTDKYQEHNVKWWDAVDIISSSGYYPRGDWENQLDRIEKVVKKFNKPFFFAETGCMSTHGSSAVPNDWSVKGDIDNEEQAAWYEEMLSAVSGRSWVGGTAIWSWAPSLSRDFTGGKGYEIYGKPSEAIVKQYYSG